MSEEMGPSQLDNCVIGIIKVKMSSEKSETNETYFDIYVYFLVCHGGYHPHVSDFKEIPVHLDQQRLNLSDPPVLKDGFTLMPMRSFLSARSINIYRSNEEPEAYESAFLKEVGTVIKVLSYDSPGRRMV